MYHKSDVNRLDTYYHIMLNFNRPFLAAVVAGLMDPKGSGKDGFPWLITQDYTLILSHSLR